MKSIVVTSGKGGVGKTTTSSALAAGLTREGKKVLGIDLDPQGNFGFSLGLDIEDSKTIYEVFKYQILQEIFLMHINTRVFVACLDMGWS